jgi:modification methylase
MAPTPTPTTNRAIPLSVWPCAQTTAQYQRTGRYLPACSQHPGKMLPALARRIITEYSDPGDLVVDPMCGVGTTLVEAAALGRRCVGVELEPRWAGLAVANLDHILMGEDRDRAQVRLGDACQLDQVLADLIGTVDLVATSPPYACDAGAIDKPAWQAGGTLCAAGTLNYAAQRSNLGHARGQAYLAGVRKVYAGCSQLLRPGGLLVVVTKNTRRAERLFDLAAATVELACGAGFGYLQHVIALHAGIRNSLLVARPSFWQLTQVRRARSRGKPVHLVAHEDVLIFAKPERADG